MNIYLIIILTAILGEFFLRTVARVLNLKALDPNLPQEFQGYYETDKYGKTFYSYNLDFENNWADSTTNFLRRKWIINNYFGISLAIHCV